MRASVHDKFDKKLHPNKGQPSRINRDKSRAARERWCISMARELLGQEP